MKRPAVFFDRDNTLIANDGYLGTPDKVVLIQGAAEAVARVRAMGFAAVTISNQSGVARGMFTEEAVHAVNARMDELLQDQSPRAIIDRHEFCPFHPQAVVPKYQQESELRKPRPGMIHQAAERLGLDLSRSWVIGDAPRDIAAGKAAGCRTILFNDPALKASSAAAEESTDPAEFVVATLKDAVDIIERESMTKSQGQAVSERAEEDAKPVTSPAAKPADASPAPALAAAGRKMTFAERVKAGTFHPTRASEVPVAVAERPKRAATSPVSAAIASASTPASSSAVAADPAPTPQVRPTEPVSDLEQLEPILQEILEEVRMMRMRQPYAEFAVSKLLAGIVQVLVLPVLFFAYLHRGTAQDVQSLLTLAAVLQTMTIALLIMGRQS